MHLASICDQRIVDEWTSACGGVERESRRGRRKKDGSTLIALYTRVVEEGFDLSYVH